MESRLSDSPSPSLTIPPARASFVTSNANLPLLNLPPRSMQKLYKAGHIDKAKYEELKAKHEKH